MDLPELSQALYRNLEANALFRESLAIVLHNTHAHDKLFLIGGIVYRTLVTMIYHTPQIVSDHDFLAEHVPSQFIGLDEQWQVSYTGLGSPRLIHSQNHQHQIDLCRLADAPNPWEQQTSPPDDRYGIASFLRRAPLDIQSFAFDWKERVLYGEVGLQALMRKSVRIYNQNECDAYIKRHQITAQAFLQKKADTLEFAIE